MQFKIQIQMDVCGTTQDINLTHLHDHARVYQSENLHLQRASLLSPASLQAAPSLLPLPSPQCMRDRDTGQRVRAWSTTDSGVC